MKPKSLIGLLRNTQRIPQKERKEDAKLKRHTVATLRGEAMPRRGFPSLVSAGRTPSYHTHQHFPSDYPRPRP